MLGAGLRRDRQARRRQHQVVQAANDDAFGRRGGAQLEAPRRGEQVWGLAKREGGNFQPVVADRAREGALALKRQLANDFVAKANAHGLTPDSAAPVGRRLATMLRARLELSATAQ